MGYYKKQLSLFKQTGLHLWELLCANEVEAVFDIELTDNQYENITEFVYDWVMSSDMSPNELCHLIVAGLKDKQFTLDDFTTKKWNEITEIINKSI